MLQKFGSTRQRIGPQSFNAVAGEDHDGESTLSAQACQFGQSSCLQKGLATEECHTLYVAVFGGEIDPIPNVFNRNNLPRNQVQHLRIAASMASDTATLHPERETPTRAFDFRACYMRGNIQVTHASLYPENIAGRVAHLNDPEGSSCIVREVLLILKQEGRQWIDDVFNNFV